MSLRFVTQVMTAIIWDKADSDHVKRMKEFGWTVSEQSSCRTESSPVHVTVMIRLTAHGTNQSTEPSFFTLTDIK